jgi:hypothetical protein
MFLAVLGSLIFFSRQQGLWELWETRVVDRGRFPKAVERPPLLAGFP